MKQREFSQATETGVGVRIWLGTLPECYLFPPEEWLSDALYRPQSQTPDEIRCAGLRLRIEGLNHSSGIFGARFTPEKTERLVVKVPVTLTTTEQANGFTRPGLPPQCAPAVLARAVKALEQADCFGPGTLEFNFGAYHIHYYSPMFFGILTEMVLLLLDPALDEASEAEIFAKVIEVIKTG